MAPFVDATDLLSALNKLYLSSEGGAAAPLRRLQEVRAAAKLVPQREAEFDRAWRSASALLASALATWGMLDKARAQEKQKLRRLLGSAADVRPFIKAYRDAENHTQREAISVELNRAIETVNKMTGARGSEGVGEILLEDAEVEKVRAIERLQVRAVAGARDVIVFPSQRGVRERAALRRVLGAKTRTAREQRWSRLMLGLHDLAGLSPEDTESPLKTLTREIKELRRAIGVVEHRQASSSQTVRG